MTFEERFRALQARRLELDRQQAELQATRAMEPALFDRALAVLVEARRELDADLHQLRAEMVAAEGSDAGE